MRSPRPAVAHVKPRFEMARCREFTSSKDNRSAQNGRVVTKWLKMLGEATNTNSRCSDFSRSEAKKNSRSPDFSRAWLKF